MTTHLKTKKFWQGVGLIALGTGIVAVATGVLGVPMDAFAQSDLKTAVTGIGEGVNRIPEIVNIAAYTAGGGSIIAGGLKLKAHGDNPGQTPLTAGLMRIMVGSLLVAMPAVAGQLLNTTGTDGEVEIKTFEGNFN